MPIPREARPSLLLLACLAVGWLAVTSRPEHVLGSEMWPAGLAAAAMFGASRRSAPWLLAALCGVGAATFALGGRPLDYSLVAGGAIAAEAAVVARILTDRGNRRPGLLADGDLRRFLLAVASGGLVAGIVLGTAAGLLTDRPPLLTGLGTLAGHMSSALVLLPFFVDTDRHPPLAGRVERAMQWLVSMGVAVAVFSPRDFPAPLFMVIPVLGWTALRSSLREAQLQLVTLATIATTMTTYGFGPLAEVQGSYALPEDVMGIVLQTFLIASALVVLLLSLVVGRQLAAIDRAESESELLRRIIDSAHVAIVGTDESGRVTLFNPGAQRLLGYRDEEVIGRHMALFHSEEAVSEKAAELGVGADFGQVALKLAEPEQAAQHMRFRRKDGTERIHALTLSRVTDRTGQVTGYVGTSEDVTDEMAAREALLDALDTERRAVARLQEIDQVKDTFVSSVSHELRTPITSIVGYLEMLLAGDFGTLDSEQEVAIRRVDSNSKRLLSLIDELLTLSRIHERRIGPSGELDLREIVRTAYEVVAPSWSRRDLDTRLETPDGPVCVLGNKELLERVVVNLLGNAVKFTPDGGAVALTLVSDDREAVLTVSDTGIGIPEEEQRYLFTRFFRSSLAQRHAIQGSGLGLSIVRAVIEEHGGRVDVVSSPGDGTAFHVRLPLAPRRNIPEPLDVAEVD